MKTLRLWAALPMAVMTAAAFAAQPCARYDGQCGRPMKDSCEEAYYQNSIWPRQYVAPSRRGICQSFDLMVNNGWRRHNLLGKYHFDPETGELSEAGRLKVEWILTQAAPDRRTIYVERIADQERTAERLESVQSFAADFSQGTVDVRETYLRNYGHPASMVDAVFTGFSASQPPPILPQTTGSASTATPNN